MWSNTPHRAANPRTAPSHASRRPLGEAGTEPGSVGSVTNRVVELDTRIDVTRVAGRNLATWPGRRVRSHYRWVTSAGGAGGGALPRPPGRSAPARAWSRAGPAWPAPP